MRTKKKLKKLEEIEVIERNTEEIKPNIEKAQAGTPEGLLDRKF